MSDSIWVKIAETPWWVYVIWIYLFYVSFLTTKPRIIPLQKLFLIPSLFLSISIVCMILILPFTLTNIFVLLGMLVLGVLLGWLQFRIMKIQAIKEGANLYIPGTWSGCIIILSLLFIKYYSGYQFELDPNLLLQPKFASIILAFSGLCAGLFLGRVAYSLRCLKVGVVC